jgi:hypothetical protein
MNAKISQRQEGEKEPTVDVEGVLLENGLQMVETGFFRGKKTVSRVKDSQGNRFILKTGKIEPFQIKLLKAAKAIEGKLCFKVPELVKQGAGWLLLKEVDGQYLSDFYREKPDWCVKVSKKIADDYQLVIQEVQKSQNFGDLLGEGEKWLFSRLNLWSKPIVDAGLIDFSFVQQLKREFEEVIERRGEDLFQWVHGNIIGDHLVVSGEDIYLLDLNAVPRAGRGYHDFLRALDFMFLKSEDEEKVFAAIPGWLKQYLSEFEENEVKLVFTFRNIGILGWDILTHKANDGLGNLEKKKEILLKFIRREC